MPDIGINFNILGNLETVKFDLSTSNVRSETQGGQVFERRIGSSFWKASFVFYYHDNECAKKILAAIEAMRENPKATFRAYDTRFVNDGTIGSYVSHNVNGKQFLHKITQIGYVPALPPNAGPLEMSSPFCYMRPVDEPSQDLFLMQATKISFNAQQVPTQDAQ